MTAAPSSPVSPPWSVTAAMNQVRTPIGCVLMITAGTGIFMGAHWSPLVPLMLAFYLATLLAPSAARNSLIWFVMAAAWVAAVMIQPSAMEDHVYLYLAWLVAIAVGLLDRDNFMDEAGRQGRYLLAIVFATATIWKLTSGSFISGAALWTSGLLDDRMAPLLNLAGISSESLADARPQVTAVVASDGETFDISLSSYSSIALTLVALGTIALEALIAVSYAAPDTSRLAKLRAPLLVGFGFVTYAIVPVLPFALLLAVIGCTVARFERRTVLAFVAMVLVAVVRFATL
ncbi:hypothetical protein OAC41_03655 [Acidimicrobiales bacterium]|nr:hypothetical protein [bacterium]MDB9845842.1 hypothetical protein [Acidimicrobiales bacterium]